MLENLLGSLWGIFLKKLQALLLAITFILGTVTGILNASNDVIFTIDTSKTNGIIGNKVSNVNVWSTVSLNSATKPDAANDITKFVDYIQIMQATGGNADRDLFKNPLDRTVLDDYDFSKLIDACRGVLNLGAKPLIHTGNVPLKLTTDPVIGVFGVNVNPPDDYDQYYTYLCAAAKALVDEFGRDEVLTWRFGVLTEYENKDWFVTKNGDAHDTFVAYCKLYDYTVAALQDTVGETVFTGGHSMTCAEGLWPEEDFIQHCAAGTNYKTGETGTRLCFLNASFYDSSPGKFADRTLPETIAILREKAESVGLNNLIYGVDEGRILSGTPGKGGSDLNLRICGQTYQAAYDARLLKQMIDNNIDYFSSWGYLSGGLWSGLPTVSYHVASRFHEMAGSKTIQVAKAGGFVKDAEIEAVAGYNENTNTLHIMAYNFKNSLDYTGTADLTFRIAVPQFDGKKVTVTRYVVDNNANFFDEWQKDRVKYNITDDCFWWSPDDPAIDTYTTLNAQWARDIYISELRPKYEEYSRLVPTTQVMTAANGSLTLGITAAPEAVVFYEITPVS